MRAILPAARRRAHPRQPRWAASQLNRVNTVRPRPVIAREPAAEPVEPWEQHALVDIQLIQLVANLPFQPCRYDDSPCKGRSAGGDSVEPRGGSGHEREERELIDDPRSDRR